MNVCEVQVETVTSFSAKFEGSSKVCLDSISTSLQCGGHNPSIEVIKVGADSRLTKELEGPSNVCEVEAEAVTSFSAKFEGSSKVCVDSIVTKGADSGPTNEFEGPLNAYEVEVEAVTSFSEKFEGSLSVCVVALVIFFRFYFDFIVM